MSFTTRTVNGEERPVCGVCRSIRSWGGVDDCLDVKIIYVQQDAAANAETNKRCVV